ncbi:MAG: ImmA/IrrE family metallo-endopeptidase [Chitinophagaceae bacterium]|nr:ImmA/IrrE family metallo-endopeptidase [Chitinophagaceae bacterium]
MLQRGFKAQAERTSLFLRAQLGLKEYDPLPAQQLAEYLNICVLTPIDIPGITDAILDLLLTTGKDCWSAAIFVRNNKEYIIHNPTHSSSRQESNIMHEIAHSVCNHELRDLETALHGCVIPLRQYDHVQEAEAEYMGGCLQLPQKALFHYHHFKKKNQDQIAEIFNASKQMVRYRLSITGVTKITLRK